MAERGDGPGTVVRAVQVWPVAAQTAGLPQGLPDALAAVAMAPAGPAWPEHHTRFAIEVVGAGTSGWHAPVGQAVARLVVDELADGLIGHDAAAPRQLRYRPRAGRHQQGAHARQAVSAVELACWDLASRACGRSVPELLGGTVRERVPVYASALGLDPARTEAVKAAEWIAGQGFWGQKWPLTKELLRQGPRAVARVLGALREATGEGRFMVDGLRRCRVDEALALLPVLADLQVTFAEELLEPGGAAWARLRTAGSGIPMAAGEHAVDEHEQIRLLAGGLVDVWQTDPGWSGGLACSLHTTEVAADLGMATFPHGDRLWAALALAGACCRDKVPAVEWHLTVEPLRQQVFTEPAAPAAGMLPSAPGAGLAPLPVTSSPRPSWEVGS
jgi:L-rhamnonate dehydratase